MLFKSFTDLELFQAARRLVIMGYKILSLLPDYERFNRAEQLRRSLSSITANIAEGFGRYNYQDNIRFCRLARGSLAETQCHFLTAIDLGQLTLSRCRPVFGQAAKVRCLLDGYIRCLKKAKKIDQALTSPSR